MSVLDPLRSRLGRRGSPGKKAYFDLSFQVHRVAGGLLHVLGPMVVNALKRWKLACPVGELDLVFPNPAGGVLAHACILKDGFGPLQVRAGVAHHVVGEDGETVAKLKHGLHALRHAAAALFIEQGFGPKRVQTILSHASIKMTFDVYGYLFASEDTDRTTMAQIEARLLSS